MSRVAGVPGGTPLRAPVRHPAAGVTDAQHKVAFEAGDPSVVLRVVHALSARCGPLVVTPDTGDPTVVVWAWAGPRELLRAGGGRRLRPAGRATRVGSERARPPTGGFGSGRLLALQLEHDLPARRHVLRQGSLARDS